jgi:transcriptional regulator NrdR family protein
MFNQHLSKEKIFDPSNDAYEKEEINNENIDKIIKYSVEKINSSLSENEIDYLIYGL